MSPPTRSVLSLPPVAPWARRAVALSLTVLTLTPTLVLADNSISGFDEVTVAPGDTAQCQSNPCRVFLKILAGDGSVTVTGNEVTWGTYPRGQTADLGQVFNLETAVDRFVQDASSGLVSESTQLARAAHAPDRLSRL